MSAGATCCSSSPSRTVRALWFLLFLSANVQALYHSPCDKSSCYPATGNLLIGRENYLTASSTCGLKQRTRYCIVNDLQDRKNCRWCDSQSPANPITNESPSHRIENIVHRSYNDGTAPKRWWQSENGVENVTIRLNLEAEFHFTHLIITFKTFRPAAMLVERSYDFGLTWQVYRYFAHDCNFVFPTIPKESPHNLTQVVCDQRYSAVLPSKNGEVILRVLPPNLHHIYNDPYSSEVQNLLKMTNLRINFTKLHTLGDNLLDNRDEILEKYYYAISEMVVRGSCSCYGHASRCLPLDGVEIKPDMVYGQCECTHNTRGLNCELCEDFFNDFPWKPAIGGQTNACRRCNCNNHATSCHHDAAVFELTGRTSGGVCDGCTDNTTGRNCEQCKQYFYQDPTKPFTDRDVCLPCDCDPSGSLDEGICDPKTDLVNGLESGRCHCKANVEGRRCDMCKNGFWNFSESNPDGCQECTCNTQGTVGNQGCNKETGECTCKRYVTGRDCNQCAEGYWGLTESQDGCKPCECDIGGSYDSMCDVQTGQCSCRPHLSGRTCNLPEQNYFVGAADSLVSEAEVSDCKHNCQVLIREPYRDGRDNTWTGTGFMKVYDDTELVFNISKIPATANYEIVLRYEPHVNYDTENVIVTLERQEPVSPGGACDKYETDYNTGDTRIISLSPYSDVAVASPSMCLEAGKDYRVRLNFQKYKNKTITPTASILVDSVVLIPDVESMPFFQGTPANKQRLQEYQRYRCKEAYYTVLGKSAPENDVCHKYHYSIGFYFLDGASACRCDQTGSTSAICDSLGGKCSCKPNVVGRDCNRCAPGTYGFGPEGCQACDCNSVGALDNFCNASNGQCKCRAQTYGRECDQCEPGSWNYPDCQRCTCNGHTDSCDSHTGECVRCQGFTEGANCDRCIEGYYGNALLGSDFPCRPCPCPGTAESGNMFAKRCALDSRTQGVYCECDVGYTGATCNVCDENYFGNPETPGGSCKKCSCNNNVDIASRGNCDPHTGKCVKCLYNTEGDSCDQCKAGFYGDAINQTCKECVCDILGSQSTECDKVAGQCLCWPNVIGLSCDECKPNHWKIASGSGCEPCNCDPVGSLSEQCNEYDGQCKCKPGFGGTRCNQCQTNYWGNPNKECYPCNCNVDGSATLQCNQSNGHCNCKKEIGGEKCDVCARGYLGVAPNCSRCGECFENWDKTQLELKEQTDNVIKSASEIKKTGAMGAYTSRFENMDKKISEIKEIVEKSTKSSIEIQMLNEVIDQLRVNITAEDQLNTLSKTIDSLLEKVTLANLTSNSLKGKIASLKENTQDLRQSSMQLQERNVEGALNITKEAYEKAETLKMKEDAQNQILSDVERHWKRTDSIFSRNNDSIYQFVEQNQNTIEKLDQEVDSLKQEIPKLNQQICGRGGDPCDNLCGGAGCGTCGGLSCDDGALTRSEVNYGLGKEAEKHIREKEAKSEELFRGISQANQELNSSLENAKIIALDANTARIQSENILNESYSLIERHQKVLNPSGVKAEDIGQKINEVLKLNIDLQPDHLRQLSEDINKTLSQPMNISIIIEDTAQNLTLAKMLNEDAEEKQKAAENILQVAERVDKALEETQSLQQSIDDDIRITNQSIMEANNTLDEIKSEINVTKDSLQKVSDLIDTTGAKLETLQADFILNSKKAENVKSEATNLIQEVNETQDKKELLLKNYYDTSTKLNDRVNELSSTHNESQILYDKANALYTSTQAKSKDLEDANAMLMKHEKQMVDLNKKLDELNERMSMNLKEIKNQADFYKVCQL